MAGRVYRTQFLLGARSQSSLARNFNRTSRFFQNTQRQAASLNRTMKAAGGALVGYLSVSAVKKFGLESAASLESYRNTLNIVMKDQEKAAQTMSWAVDFANKTPFETESIVEATVKLQSYGLKAQEVLPNIGNMAGVMGKDIMQATEAFADAQTGELERFKEFGITKAMIAEKAGKMYKNQQIINNKGQIVEQEKFNNALMSLMEDRFKGGMEKQANTWNGLKSTISGVFKTGMANIMGISKTGEIVQGSLFDSIKNKAKGMAKVMTDLANNGTFEKIGKRIADTLKFISMTGNKAFDLMEGPLKNLIKTAKKIYAVYKNNVLEVFNNPALRKFGSDLITNVKNILPSLKNFAKLIAGAYVKILPVLKDISVFFIEKILPVVSDVFGFIANKLIPKLVQAFSKWLPQIIKIFKKVWGLIKPIINTLIKAFEFAFPFIKQIILVAINTIVPVVNGLLKTFIGIIDFLSGVFTGDWKKVWEGIQGIFGGIFESLVGLAKTPLNVLIGLINGVIEHLNNVDIKIPVWVDKIPGVPDEWAGKTFGLNIPPIQPLEKGGYVKHRPGGILANIGEGRYDEIVAPLPDLRKLLNISLKLNNVFQVPTSEGWHDETVTPLPDTRKLLDFPVENRNISNRESQQFVFSPNITISGDVDESAVNKVMIRSYSEFKQFMKKYQNDKDRLNFAGGDY